MRKLLLSLSIFALSGVAVADASFGVRGDVVGTNSYSDPKSTNQPGSSYLDVQFVRAMWTGKINDSLTGTMVLDFLQAISGSQNVLKVAEVDHKIEDGFTFGIGRLADAGMAGWEFQRPFYDHWFFSQGYFANFPLGANLNINFNPDQQLKLVVLNQNWDNGASGGLINYATTNMPLNNSGTTPATSQTNLGYGARYLGKFGDFGVIVSYDLAQNNAVGTNNTNTYLVVGGKYQAGDMTATLDYMNYTFNGIGTNNADNGSKNVIVAMFNYKLGQFTPRAKIESTTLNDVPSSYYLPNGGTTTTLWGQSFSGLVSGAYQNQISRYDVGVDYKVHEADPSYYSVHYIASSQVFSGSGLSANFSTKTINESAVYLSYFAKADILK